MASVANPFAAAARGVSNEAVDLLAETGRVAPAASRDWYAGRRRAPPRSAAASALLAPGKANRREGLVANVIPDKLMLSEAHVMTHAILDWEQLMRSHEVRPWTAVTANRKRVRHVVGGAVVKLPRRGQQSVGSSVRKAYTQRLW